VRADTTGHDQLVEGPRGEERIGVQLAPDRLRRASYVVIDVVELSGAGPVALTHERIRQSA